VILTGKTLLVIIEDELNALIDKGEVTDRYYNPGNLFDEVHILMLNEDHPDKTIVQKTVGRAQLHMHNMTPPSLLRTLGWQPFLMQSWVRSGLNLARRVRPALIRTYANYLNGFLGAQIRNHLKVPLVVSVHTHPDESERWRVPWWPQYFLMKRLRLERRKMLERIALRAADCVIVVCESYREYALRYGAHRTEIIHNLVNPTHLHRKTSYDLHSPPRVISVGRQIPGKNPVSLIRAVAELPVILKLVGDGELHEYLRQAARDCGASDRVIFQRAVNNDELCEMLPDFDIFAAHSDYCGIPKAIIEPLLVGLPVVINRERAATPELSGDWILAVENTPQGYRRALLDLIQQYEQRTTLGNRAYEYAQERFNPAKIEQQLVDLYRELLAEL